MAGSTYKKCFKYAGVSFTELMNENVLSLATNLSTAPSKLLLTGPTVSVPGLILYVVKFFDDRKRCC